MDLALYKINIIIIIIRFPLQRPQFGAHNDVHRNQWFNRDLEAMAEALNTDEVFIDADRSECS